MKINISKMNKAIVLMALYNASKMQGNSFLGGDGSSMTEQEATERLKSQTYFDYLNGKVMKIDFKSDVLETWLYDRDNGNGAALKAIQKHYPDAVAITEEEAKEVKKVVLEGLEYTKANKEQAEGRMNRKKEKKKSIVKPQAKIEYRKGFFTVNGEVRKETKKQYAGRVVDTVSKLSEAGFKAKVDKSKK
jgi:hypothetical protein